MSLLDEEIVFCQTVLRKAAVDNVTRLENGVKLRREMYALLKQGKDKVAGNYRYNWLKSSSAKVLELLRNITAAFNVQHSDDLCSIQDLKDILQISKNNVVKK